MFTSISLPVCLLVQRNTNLHDTTSMLLYTYGSPFHNLHTISILHGSPLHNLHTTSILHGSPLHNLHTTSILHGSSLYCRYLQKKYNNWRNNISKNDNVTVWEADYQLAEQEELQLFWEYQEVGNYFHYNFPYIFLHNFPYIFL